MEDFIYIYISVVCNASFFFVSRRESLGEIEEFFRFGGGGGGCRRLLANNRVYLFIIGQVV